MIEIKKDILGNFKLFVDENEKLAKIHCNKKSGLFTVNINDFSVAQQIMNYEFEELTDIYFLSLPIITSWSELLDRVYVLQSKIDKYEMKFRFSNNFQKWKDKKKYSKYFNAFSIFVDKFNTDDSNLIENPERDFVKIKLKTIVNNTYGFDVIFTTKKLSLTLLEEINRYLEILHNSHNLTLQLTNTNFRENIVLTYFEFPEELKVSCKQYLEYFATFLNDLGLKANSNLKEEAGKVLFSVTPTDDVEALDKIREALAVYLHLPSSPIVYDESFAAMRQKQQIDNLQHSQRMVEMEFRLSQKVIESQDKIISQKDMLIDQQREVIEKIKSKSIMIDSAENKEELEEIFEGFRVGESKFLAEQLGLHLNPATALKTVGKKILGQTDESKSILGLNEKD